MSKLDYILSRTIDAVAKGVVTDEWEKVDTKQQIKDLFTQIIQDNTDINQMLDEIKQL